MKYFGYRHTNGTLHLKRLFSLAGFEEVLDSPFVEDVFGPFEAKTRDEATKKLRAELSGGLQ